MNMFKKNGGFTLVELIVVIAILAILAGVAVPAYSGYIEKAKDAAVITELDAIATAAQAANAAGGEISAIHVTAANAISIEIAATATVSKTFKSDFEMFYGGTVTVTDNAKTASVALDSTEALELDGTSYANGADWTNAGGWVAKATSNN